MKVKIGLTLSVIVLSLIGYFTFLDESSNYRGLASIKSDFTKVIPDKYFFTVDKNLSIEGPVYDKNDPAPYFEKTLGKLLQAADSIAKEDWFLEGAKNEYYYAFLLGALTVPFHESYWINFRKRQNVDVVSKKETKLLCETGGNDFESLRPKFSTDRLNSTSRVTRSMARYSKWTYDFLNANYRDRFPVCSNFNPGDEVVQFLSSGFYVDMGLMQLNAKAHPDLYLDNQIFILSDAIKYGLDYYYKGFNKFLLKASDEKNKEQYSCLLNKDGSVNPFRLIVASWAGFYNSGPSGQVCRFWKSVKCAKKIVSSKKENYYSWFKHNKEAYTKIIDMYPDAVGDVTLGSRDCDYAKNDLSMLNDLQKMSIDHSAHVYKYLPDNGKEKLALKEIVTNLKEGKSVTTSLDKILTKDYSDFRSLADEVGNVAAQVTEVVDDVAEEKPSEEVKPAEEVIHAEEVSEVTQEVTPIESDEYLLSVKDANIRIAPAGSGLKCGNSFYLNKDNIIVKVVTIENGYLKVINTGLEGAFTTNGSEKQKCIDATYLFIHKTLANKLAPVISPRAVKVKKVEKTATVAVSVGLRANLSVYSAFTGFMTQETSVVIVGEDDFANTHWYQIVDSSGTKGWVDEFYLRLD